MNDEGNKPPQRVISAADWNATIDEMDKTLSPVRSNYTIADVIKRKEEQSKTPLLDRIPIKEWKPQPGYIEPREQRRRKETMSTIPASDVNANLEQQRRELFEASCRPISLAPRVKERELEYDPHGGVWRRVDRIRAPKQPQQPQQRWWQAKNTQPLHERLRKITIGNKPAT